MTMNSLGVITDYPQLRLKRFTWDTDLQVTVIEFSPGLNLLSDRQQTERTIILRLIRYAMGADADRIDKNIQQATKEVMLEFEVNGHQVTTRRSFERPSGQFAVFINDSPRRQLTPTEFKNELMSLMNIPIVTYQNGKNKATLSFDDLARAFVVDRDLSYQEILSKVYPKPRRLIVRMMLGLITQEIADMEFLEEETRGRIEQIEQEIEGIRRMLKDFEVEEIEEITRLIEEHTNALNEQESQEIRLRQSIASHISAQFPAEEYDALRGELIQKRMLIQNIDANLTVLAKQIVDKSNLKELLQEEVDKLERHTSSRFVLSSFTFTRCPRCLQPIEEHMKEREIHGNCMLCDRPLPQQENFDSEAWEKSQTDTVQAIRETDVLLSSYEQQHKEYTQAKSELTKRVEWIELELARQTVNYVSPYIEQMSLVSERKAQILRQRDYLELKRMQREYFNQIRDTELPGKEQELERLKNTLQNLRSKHGSEFDRKNAFAQHFTHFLRVAMVQVSKAEISDNDWLPVIDGQRHTQAKSGPDLAIVVLAFHYACLAMCVGSPKYDTAHPKLLIIDEPEQQKMDVSQFKRIMRQLTDLANANKGTVQIIVAVTDSRGFEDHKVEIQTLLK